MFINGLSGSWWLLTLVKCYLGTTIFALSWIHILETLGSAFNRYFQAPPVVSEEAAPPKEVPSEFLYVSMAFLQQTCCSNCWMTLMQGHFVVWKGLTERWFKLSAYFHTMSGLTSWLAHWSFTPLNNRWSRAYFLWFPRCPQKNRWDKHPFQMFDLHAISYPIGSMYAILMVTITSQKNPSHVSIFLPAPWMLWDIQWINMLIHEPMVISGLTSEHHYQLITGSYYSETSYRIAKPWFHGGTFRWEVALKMPSTEPFGAGPQRCEGELRAACDIPKIGNPWEDIPSRW